MSSAPSQLFIGPRDLFFAITLALVVVARAEILYWAGADGDPATAGGGRWDMNDSVTWRDGDPAGTLVKWTEHRDAVFQGSAGGIVTIAEGVTVDTLRFESAAAAFTLATSGGTIVLGGGGIICDSPAEQRLSLHQTILNFRNEASAGNGTQASRVQIISDGLASFADSATAGRATFMNSGELQFTGRSSAGDATITNTSLLIFLGEARSGAAAIANQGQLMMQDHAREHGAAAFVNFGLLDVSAIAPEDTATLGALTNFTGGILLLGAKTLAIGHLQLAGENNLSFDIGADASGSIAVTGALLHAGSKKTRIGISDAGGLKAGGRHRLIDWSAATWVSGVKAATFALDSLPAGFSGKLKIDGKALWLEVSAGK